MKKFRLFMHAAFEADTVRTAIWVCIVVGLLLNLINQGTAMVHFQFDQLDWPKLLMTFAVPYLVATYSGAMAKMKFSPGKTAAVTANLKCAHCNKCEVHIHQGDIIPLCPECLELTDWQLVD